MQDTVQCTIIYFEEIVGAIVFLLQIFYSIYTIILYIYIYIQCIYMSVITDYCNCKFDVKDPEQTVYIYIILG